MSNELANPQDIATDTPRTDAHDASSATLLTSDPTGAYARMRAHARQLERELAAAEKDARRLQWVADNILTEGHVSGPGIEAELFSFYAGDFAGGDLRRAIDRAMADGLTREAFFDVFEGVLTDRKAN